MRKKVQYRTMLTITISFVIIKHWCLLTANVLRFFQVVRSIDRCVIMVFPDHAHLLFKRYS